MERVATIRRNIYLVGTGAIVIGSLFIMVCFSGFHYEANKFKSYLITLVIVYIGHFLIIDPISFALQAVYLTLRDKGEVTPALYYRPFAYTPIETLKLKLERLKSQLLITEKHQNETLNQRYKEITRELWLFSKYFIVLLLVVVGSRNDLAYYNTHIVDKLLTGNYISSSGLSTVENVHDVYDFLNGTLVQGFNEARDYNNAVIPESGWIQFEMAKLLGVVRLKQVRLQDPKRGLREPVYAQQDFLPAWRLPFKHYHYVDKYWRIYRPWMLQSQYRSHWHTLGSLHRYDAAVAYESLLARNVQNNNKILEFLKNATWLDARTAALFVDFTLFNVDANIFSVCSILFEQTPFGGVVSAFQVHSTELLYNMSHLSGFGLVVLVLYIFQFIQFAKVFCLRLWFKVGRVWSLWHVMDLLIIALNVCMVAMLFVRESMVERLVHQLANSEKLAYVDFREAGRIDNYTLICAGFLVALTTLRIWKILQFDSAFRMFTRTLQTARTPLLNVSLVAGIFVGAFGIAAFVVNGNNTENFTRLVKSISSIMCFGFGFSSSVDPSDLNHGGTLLGFCMYVLLMFGLAILLVNFFITLICDKFSAVKANEASSGAAQEQLSYWQFLRVEYNWMTEYLQCFRLNKYNVVPGMYETLVKKTLEASKRDITYEKEHVTSIEKKHNKRAAKMEKDERTEKIGKILKIQMELLTEWISLNDDIDDQH